MVRNRSPGMARAYWDGLQRCCPGHTLTRSEQANHFKGDGMSAFFAAVDIGDSVQTGLDGFFGFLPKLLGFLVILAIGWIIAKVVKGAVSKLLERVGADRALHSGTA